MTNPTNKLPPLPADVLSAITPETHLKLKANNNWTPDPDSGIEPGERTFIVTIGEQIYAATKEQANEVATRTGMRAQSKAFLAEKLPHLFGKAKA